MKAELVADTVEANPFPYNAKNRRRSQMPSPRKTFAAMFQSIHFLPAQQFVKQTRRALPAIIPNPQRGDQSTRESTQAPRREHRDKSPRQPPLSGKNEIGN